MLELNELVDKEEGLYCNSTYFADSVPQVLRSVMSVLIKVLHPVQSTYINVEANDEDKIDVEFCEEEILSVTVPFKVDYYLNCFLLEKV